MTRAADSQAREAIEAEKLSEEFIEELGAKRHLLTSKQIINLAIFKGYLAGHLKGFSDGAAFALEKSKKLILQKVE